MPNNKYKYLFFDLDDTLWDFNRSAEEAKTFVFEHFKLKEKGIDSIETFIKNYLPINKVLWDSYRANKIDKQYLNLHRFHDTLKTFGIDDREFAQNMANTFISEVAKEPYVYENTVEILEYLKPNYKMHIITNGFEEVQNPKLAKSGISPYFETVTTCEKSNSMKPLKEFFDFALNQAKATKEESLIIGDDYIVDIVGARNADIDSVWLNPNNADAGFETYSITNIIDLKNIL